MANLIAIRDFAVGDVVRVIGHSGPCGHYIVAGCEGKIVEIWDHVAEGVIYSVSLGEATISTKGDLIWDNWVSAEDLQFLYETPRPEEAA